MKIRLKRKYTDGIQSGGGKSGTSNSSVKGITLQKYLMNNERAIKMHYEECAAKGYMEQIPTGLRAKYDESSSKK